MKKYMIPIIGLSLVLVSFSGEKLPEDETSPGKNRKRVLIIGFQQDKMTSNFYLKDDIASKTKISPDSLESLYSQAIIDGFTSIASKELEFIPCYDNRIVLEIHKQVRYDLKKDIVLTDITMMDMNTYKDFLNRYNADYLLFINQYKFSWMGNPFNAVFHIINYNLFNDSQNRLYAGQTSFNMEKIKPLAELDGKYKKQAKKIIVQCEKAVLLNRNTASHPIPETQVLLNPKLTQIFSRDKK